MKSPLLYSKRPLVVNPDLAVAVGLNEAIVLHQINYWIELNEQADRNFQDGYFWTYNTIQDWQKQFPWWSYDTVKRILRKLEKSGVLISGVHNKEQRDRTKWYRINHGELNRLFSEKSGNFPLGQNALMQECSLPRPLPETTTENNNVDNEEKGCFSSKNEPHTFSFDAETMRFINWYRTGLYPQYYDQEHPALKLEQLHSVHGTLLSFRQEYDIGFDGLCEMARSFMERVESNDHNINHFVSGDMLEIRFYDCGIY